jgi:hypothetical protein
MASLIVHNLDNVVQIRLFDVHQVIYLHPSIWFTARGVDWPFYGCARVLVVVKIVIRSVS